MEGLTTWPTRVLTYDHHQLGQRAPVLFRQSDNGRLALVICSDWDGTAFRWNTVVLANPVPTK